ncbi:hypothetical protein [Dyadobacter chenhuakuii]|uniref:Uncharacterized protein n=1 Tax=Dyadobacter chenhuakuii TaxID=2909339 RepID=A0ABY5EA16_9BACT|nr:hypothetical protein [Dyadobacter chenhuakuii]UTM21792.1 hypothetical protein NFI80_25295 [Dyadobacter chenhuakuii]
MKNVSTVNVVIDIPHEIHQEVIGNLPFSLAEFAGITQQGLLIGQVESGDNIEDYRQILKGLALRRFRLEFGAFKTRSYQNKENPYELLLSIKKTKQYNAFKQSLVQGIAMVPIKDVEWLIASEIPMSYDETMEAVSHFQPKRVKSFLVSRLLLTREASGYVEFDLPLTQESLPLFPLL